jgi:ankyrin repeat protein
MLIVRISFYIRNTDPLARPDEGFCGWAHIKIPGRYASFLIQTEFHKYRRYIFCLLSQPNVRTDHHPSFHNMHHNACMWLPSHDIAFLSIPHIAFGQAQSRLQTWETVYIKPIYFPQLFFDPPQMPDRIKPIFKGHLMLKIPTIIIIFLLSPILSLAQVAPDPLYVASRSGDIKTVKTIIQERNDPNSLNMALRAAILGDQLEIMKLIIKKGADLNQLGGYKTSLLINTIMGDHLKAAEILIQSGAKLKVRGYQNVQQGFAILWDWTPLMCASYKGSLDLVKLLVSKKVNIHEEGWSSSPEDTETAADIAAYSGHLPVLQYLLKLGAKLKDETIDKATRGGHLEVVKFLLAQKKTDINRLNAQGKTLLMEASWWGHVEVVKLLLENGADVRLENAKGYTALSEACANPFADEDNQIKIIKLLLAHKAEINPSEKYQITPLMRAVENKLNNVAQFLIQNGAK